MTRFRLYQFIISNPADTVWSTGWS